MGSSKSTNLKAALNTVLILLTLLRQQEFRPLDYLLLYHYYIHTHVHMRMPVLTMIVNTHRDASKLILRVRVRQTAGINPPH